MKLGASKPKPSNNNTRSVNRITTNLSRNNNKTQAPKTAASKGPSVNLALDSWNNKTQEKAAPKVIETIKAKITVAASRGPSVNLALDSWNTKTEEKVVNKNEPKVIEHKNGVSKKNGEKGDFFSDFDDKNEEKVAEEIEKVKEPMVEVRVKDKTEVEEKSPTVEKVVEKPNKEGISE